jgi:glycosyltransferase involved in cell wall biosynthesis
MSHKLTVVIPCKNERANIAACLESARRVADELLVADSGSTDGTLEYLASQPDCRVIEREYGTSGDFKNWAIPQATHDWVLVLDADERIPTALAYEIRATLSEPPEADGFWIYRNNHLMGHPVHHTDWGRDKVLRLFRRDLGRYSGPSDHGEVEVSTGRVGTLREKLDHYTFWSWGDWLRKLDRYATVQATQWYAAGRKPSYFKLVANPPFRFFRDYVIHRGFLDGMVGAQVAWSSAFLSFMKQARLWELAAGKQPAEFDGEASVDPTCHEPRVTHVRVPRRALRSVRPSARP